MGCYMFALKRMCLPLALLLLPPGPFTFILVNLDAMYQWQRTNDCKADDD